ncbi:heterochromatin protein 5 [Musca autumnalis]|uniref:heterochromatin protein 5 n=1 Tax=Musca autumnalis TaxID=221902 RepID=UPI003CF7010E
MDLFDKLKTTRPVEKSSKKEKDEKVKKSSSSSHNKDNGSHHKSSSSKHHDHVSKDSPDKKNSSIEKKKDKQSHSHKKGDETPSKKHSHHDNGKSKSSSSSPEKSSKHKHHKSDKGDGSKKRDHDHKSKPIKPIAETSKSGKENSHRENDDNESPPKKKPKVEIKAKESDEKKKKSNSSSSSNHAQKVEKFNAQHKREDPTEGKERRRESLPSPIPPLGVTKKKSNKSRSLSPPKNIPPALTKQLKVKLERSKLEDFSPIKGDGLNSSSAVKDVEPKKKTPTKAQQKLFEPTIGQKKTKGERQVLKSFNVKQCVVRIHRDNLQKLTKEFKMHQKKPATNQNSSPTSKNSGSPTSKKGKANIPPTKVKTGFFIKITTPSKSDKKLKISKLNSSSSTPSSNSTTTKSPSLSSSKVAQNNKIKNSKSITTTTPTKFSRTQLIKTFGKKWFNCHVRVRKCNHPIARTFMAKTPRARKQNKNNRKNLSVSFRDEVEVLGTTSESDDDSRDENFCATAIPANFGSTPMRNSSRNSSSTLNVPMVVPNTPLPARLKKLENGRVVDDIVLDPSLFLGPENLISSTPFSPGRKKREHKKSFSPLKDEETQSPRKEQLKRANERVPPTGLRRLNIDDEDEDDDDDDCEYIVPIDMPQRRASRTSSTNAAGDTVPSVIPPTFDDASVVPFSSTTMLTQIDEAITMAKGLVSPVTSTTPNPDSNENTTNNANNNRINHSNNTSDNTESRDSFISAKENQAESLSPTDDLNHVAAPGVPQQQNSTKTNGNVSNTLVGGVCMSDIPLNLFTEDSQTNEDAPEKNYVDNIINDLGSDIGNDSSSAL